jgi:hypothetical protein
MPKRTCRVISPWIRSCLASCVYCGRGSDRTSGGLKCTRWILGSGAALLLVPLPPKPPVATVPPPAPVSFGALPSPEPNPPVATKPACGETAPCPVPGAFSNLPIAAMVAGRDAFGFCTTPNGSPNPPVLIACAGALVARWIASHPRTNLPWVEREPLRSRPARLASWAWQVFPCALLRA